MDTNKRHPALGFLLWMMVLPGFAPSDRGVGTQSQVPIATTPSGPMPIATTPSAPVPNAGTSFTTLSVVISYDGESGTVYVMLWDKDDGFPTRPAKAVRRSFTELEKGRATLIFEGVTPGEWAVSAFLDVNRNGKLDTNFIGIPSEPVGGSGKPSWFGPPDFDDAKFTVGDGPKTVGFAVSRI